MSAERDKCAKSYHEIQAMKGFVVDDEDVIVAFKAGWDAREDEVSRLKDLLKIAETALKNISGDYYQEPYVGGLSSFKREHLEEVIENDTRIAKEALSQLRASTEGEK